MNRMAGIKGLLKKPSNFQSSAMFEGSECVEVEGVSVDSTMASSVSACKKVLCGNSVLDSPDFWLKNDKTLCRLGLTEEDSECTIICFVNVDSKKTNCREEPNLKMLSSVSPDLPRLVEVLTSQQSKDNELLLLDGLEAQQQHKSTGVCLLQCSGQKRRTEPANVILEINKFLMGLQWGRERQLQQQQGRAVQRAEDDTNRSISSIEDDFQTASEHLGEDSEDDGFRNESESSDLAETVAEGAPKHSIRLCQRGLSAQHPTTSEAKAEIARQASLQTKESAGYYATNLAESVLQDAFIRLSQDESSFVSEAAVSVSRTSPAHSESRGPTQQRTCSFELPKIVIVQSPDSSEGPGEWSESHSSNIVDTEESETSENGTPVHIAHHCSAHASKHVEVALACAANVIGTITSPQVTEKLAMESEDDNEEEVNEPEEEVDYSLPSAMCGMAQVAGAVAAVELTEESGECVESDVESVDVHAPSRGLMSAVEASTAFTLHCSVVEGTSVEAFRANIAEILHREAAEVLTQPQGYKSIAHLLETTHYKIVDGITCPKKCTDDREVDDMINEVADSLFKHALEKARKKKELEGCGKEVPSFQHFLQESVNNLLFDVLCITQKKINHVSRSDQSLSDSQADENNLPDTTANRNGKLHCLINSNQPANSENRTTQHSVNKVTIISKERHLSEDRHHTSPPPQREQAILRQNLSKCAPLPAKEFSEHLSSQQGSIRDPLSEIPVHCAERRGRLGTSSDSRQSSLTPQSSLNSCSSLVSLKMDTDSKTPITCYAEDLASTVVSMATELAAICLENSTGKQPWFCALKGATTDGTEAYLIPACRTVLRRKDGPGSNAASKKHRAPRLSEIKRKTEEQPELMERLVNRVVDETVHPDEMQDPFALFASEVTARIMNCPELNVVDTSKAGQPRSRLQCERWSRGKASSYESIPEEDSDPSGTANTLGPGSRLGQNLSRGSSISKQSSCESITDEFSRFMVNQMETEGRGFDLLLDYYAGKNASSILAAAVQQAATKKNGHLNVRASSCLSKQSSTESITEEFYRFMLRDMDKENKDYGIAKTKEWSNSLFPPSPRSPFCIRQSSVPDRRSSDSRLTVNSPIKANSFDGFARNVHGDTLNIYPSNSVSATGLCKSDSCLYQRGKTDQITDMLIHETWSSSIESLMRKNKIIADPEDSIDLEVSVDSQPHVQQFANRLAADIVDIGKCAIGGQQDSIGAISQPHMPVGERRRGFKQSHLSCSRSKSSQEQTGNGFGSKDSGLPRVRGPRDVPLIHIEGDQKVEESLPQLESRGAGPKDPPPENSAPKRTERVSSNSSERDRVVKRDKRSLSASSEESMGSWSHMSPEEDPPEESSSFIHLSEGNGTSSASSLGLTDLEAFSEVPTQSTLISEQTERGYAAVVRGTVPEGSLVKPAGDSTNPRELQVLNCDLDSDSRDWELRVTLQWIAASELGLSALYFRRSKERREAKFQRVVLLMTQKAWRVGDLFRAVLQFCEKSEEEEEEEQGRVSGLFDWLLQTL
ncbi:A-kinase anchor protein SPHKAP [Periophthalmus magnuspinnatus]|uniref:A-kinase anchor protein SPHKAP n=1 Tax=Periophthalmus magnuspinnatus TaxID=409849 RepID=UPI00145BB8CA|nr:A-kinase anchor protein SPHKAP [Periophthalmus magnuspinnatus]